MAENSPQVAEETDASATKQASSTPVAPRPQELQQERDPSARFRGPGTSFKAKLIGIDEVPDSRGDKMCQDSILKLKAAVKVSGQHKQKVVINVSLEGLKIIDAMTATILHQHPVHRISFIARDLTDRRAFGYIFGAKDEKHAFFGIKTAKAAEQLVLTLRDLFQVVYDMKTAEMEDAKKQAQDSTEETYAVPNNRPFNQQKQGNLFEIEEQLQNINQMSDIDAFKSPWPEATPTSPDTPGSPTNDMFGMANLSDVSSLSSDFSMASASSSALDHNKHVDIKSHFVDTRPPQSQHFHRTSSGKSAISWHGSTSHHLSGLLKRDSKKRRHGSLSSFQENESDNTTGAKTLLELSQKLKTVNITSVNDSEKQKGDSATKSDDKTEVNTIDKMATSTVEEAPLTKHNGHATPVSGVNTTSESFFNEVMKATGMSSATTTTTATHVVMSNSEEKPVRKASDTMNEMSGSVSSLSSANSKASTPKKSLSITNLFFSKPDKNKSSLKRKKKNISRQSSSASVTSVTDSSVATVMHTVTDMRAPSAEHTFTSNTSLQSSQVQRTSSTSSTNSSEKIMHSRLSRGYSSTSLASESSRYESKTSHERIPPPASAARARPRAIPSVTARASKPDSRNPPMFKARKNTMSESEDESHRHSQFSLDSGQSGSSLNSPSNVIAEKIEFGTKVYHEDGDHGGGSDNHFGSWACFDNGKTNKSGDHPEGLNDCAFPKENLESKSRTLTKNNVWAAFGDEQSDKVEEEKQPANASMETEIGPNDHLFPSSNRDPFSDDFHGDVPFKISEDKPFENFDPFGEVIPEDPFQNMEDFFGKAEMDNSSVADKHSTEDSSSEREDEDPFKWAGDAEDSDSSMKKTSDSDSHNSSDTGGDQPNESTLSPLANDAVVLSKKNEVNTDEEKIQSRDDPSSRITGTDTDGASIKIRDHSSFCNPPPTPPPPPPIPPRPPRNTLIEEEDERLPPTLPPPPLPPTALEYEQEPSSPEENDSDDHHYTFPPDCEPPALPSEVEIDASLPPINSLPPAIPCRSLSRQSSNASASTLKSRESPPVVPSRNLSRKSSSSLPSSINYSSDPQVNKSDSPSNAQADYSGDLAALSMDAIQPAGSVGAKLTKDQILAGFGQGVAAPNAALQQQQQFASMFGQQQPAYSVPQQPVYTPSRPAPVANPLGGTFGGAPQVQTPIGGMFPSTPAPSIPARPGAMRPPVAAQVQTGAAQNPFGDAFGGMGVGTPEPLLAPVNSQPDLLNGSGKKEEKADPFASLVPDIGNKPSAGNKKDMFKGFQMAKPPQPPPRSSTSGDSGVTANFSDYMMKSVGGVPVDEVNNSPPVPTPRSTSQDPFSSAPASNDPFAALGASGFDQPFSFDSQNQNNNSQSLFG
ncbi:uncharacterized protein LOC143461225 [Clavelina lepadiformis]|uniref:uncharacterized protein LOC143461225 n=1 Tax=Clavelina lepadiformis TaxID=159417 RepID=UPI004042E6AF